MTMIMKIVDGYVDDDDDGNGYDTDDDNDDNGNDADDNNDYNDYNRK